MKFRRLSLLTSLFLLAGTAVAFAQPVSYTIDVGHSLVGFNVRHFFSRTPGRFKDFSGTVQYDAKNLAASSVDVTIQTASIDTENERRDNDLRSGNFFLADTFPTITFKSTKVVPGSGNDFKIEGNLTMRGVTKPVTLDATLMGAGDVAMGGRPPRKLAGFEAKTTVNRKDWGIVWNRALDQGGTMLGDDVNITLQIEAVARPPEAAAAPAADKAADKK